MTTLYLDTETFSEVDLKKCGGHRYSQEAEAILAATAVDDGPVDVVDTGITEGWREKLQRQIDDADTVVIHNSAFDMWVLLHSEGVTIPIEKVEDTMILALLHSLPGDLDRLCKSLGLPPTDGKLAADGKRLIGLFCKPQPKGRKVLRATRATHPEQWEQFKVYAAQDIIAMRAARKRIPRWNWGPATRDAWMRDRRINERGVAVDIDFVTGAIAARERVSAHFDAAIAELTGGAVTSSSKAKSLREYLQTSADLVLPDLTKGTVAEVLADKDRLTDEQKALLENRQLGSSTAPAKFAVVLRAHWRSRVYGLHQFCGADRTGRYSGRLVQTQNLPRPAMGHDLEHIIEYRKDVKAGIEDLIYGPEEAARLLVSSVRSAFVAAAGKKLLVGDWSNIEGRILAWLAGEQWLVKAFSDFDAGIGDDLYVLTYARSFGVPIEQVKADKKSGGNMRQIGKVLTLACGYQGSVGAFNTMGKIYGVSMPEDEARQLVYAWRDAHPAIRSFWYDIERAIRDAVANEGVAVRCRKVALHFSRGWLRIRLPSGRFLTYKDFRVDPDNNNLTYMGRCPFTKQWKRLTTYGGHVAENCTQAIAADVLNEGLKRAEEEGLDVVLHVHDEIVAEVDPSVALRVLLDLMARPIVWAPGLPLASAGFETPIYFKD